MNSSLRCWCGISSVTDHRSSPHWLKGCAVLHASHCAICELPCIDRGNLHCPGAMPRPHSHLKPDGGTADLTYQCNSPCIGCFPVDALPTPCASPPLTVLGAQPLGCDRLVMQQQAGHLLATTRAAEGQAPCHPKQKEHNAFTSSIFKLILLDPQAT